MTERLGDHGYTMTIANENYLNTSSCLYSTSTQAGTKFC